MYKKMALSHWRELPRLYARSIYFVVNRACSDYNANTHKETKGLATHECEELADFPTFLPEEKEAASPKELEFTWKTVGKSRVPVLMFYTEILNQSQFVSSLVKDEFQLSYKIGKSESKVLNSILQKHGMVKVSGASPYFNLYWTGGHFKTQELQSLKHFQKINHFSRSYELTRKDRLSRNIKKIQELKGAKYFNILPKTFQLPDEYSQFAACHSRERGTWIVKPVASSQGRGIYLVNNPLKVQSSITKSVVVSRYIERPLLIDSFKFDIRLYVAVTSYDPLRIYLYKEGLTRFATVPYDHSLRDLRELHMHLTNYSINKESLDYVRCEDPDVEDYGNKWSMSAMLRHLKKRGVDTVSLMLNIEDVIIKSIISVAPAVAHASNVFQPNAQSCFELYGFDILVDEDLKPWLIEVNLSPSLGCDAPLDYKIKSNLICDLLTLVGVQLQDPYSRDEGLQELKARTFSTQRKLVSHSKPHHSKTHKSVLAEAKEEYIRRGNFVRIFPTESTWDLYGTFLSYKSTFNQVLHQELYGDSSQPSCTLGRDNPKGFSGMHRVMVYERKLTSKESPTGALPLSTLLSTDKPTTTVYRVLGDSQRSKAVTHSRVEVERKDKRVKVERKDKRVEVERKDKGLERLTTQLATLTADADVLRGQMSSREDSSNVESILSKISLLSQIQARQVFTAYLSKVQDRLLTETNHQLHNPVLHDSKRQQDLDVVMMFLKQAAPQLQDSFKLTFPGPSLSINQKQHLLAKQLVDFITLYKKDTSKMEFREQLYSSYFLKSENTFIPESSFKKFLISANETELEQVLLSYSKASKTSSLLFKLPQTPHF